MIQTSFFPKPEKNEPIKIIRFKQGDTSIFQPRKLEEVLTEIDIPPDTYMIYPHGGYHLFYGVPNTFPLYQLPIWPYVKRIKYSCPDRVQKKGKPNHDNSQTNPFLGTNEYPFIELIRSSYRSTYFTRTQKTRRVPNVALLRFHRVIALAWIPNPEKSKNVCHINHDRTNYLIENLKWGTQSENMRGKLKKRPDTLEQKYLNLVDREIIKG